MSFLLNIFSFQSFFSNLNSPNISPSIIFSQYSLFSSFFLLNIFLSQYLIYSRYQVFYSIFFFFILSSFIIFFPYCPSFLTLSLLNMFFFEISIFLFQYNFFLMFFPLNILLIVIRGWPSRGSFDLIILLWSAFGFFWWFFELLFV